MSAIAPSTAVWLPERTDTLDAAATTTTLRHVMLLPFTVSLEASCATNAAPSNPATATCWHSTAESTSTTSTFCHSVQAVAPTATTASHPPPRIPTDRPAADMMFVATAETVTFVQTMMPW